MNAPDRSDAPPPRKPRRGLGGALSAFLEERNILWGELVGGLLVVGCSAALIISLWHRFSHNPLFKLATFTGATAAVFGAGLYTLQRWRLASTSRGLLLIGTLLVPLDLLALTLPVAGSGGVLDRAVQVLSLLILGMLVWRAGRVLVPDLAGLLAAGVTAIAACEVPLPRWLEVDHANLLLPALLPALCFVGFSAGVLRRRAGLGLTGRQALDLFLFLGVAGLALVVALGLGIYLRDDAALALAELAVPLAVAGLPFLAGGACVHRGLTQLRDTSYRTAGTTLALTGMVVMLLAVGLAWPQPLPLLAIALIDFTALTAVAFVFRLPVAHAAALPCLALSVLLASFLAFGMPRGGEAAADALLAQALMPRTGFVLLGLALVLATLAELLARTGAHEHARFYAIGALGVALPSLSLATFAGLEMPARASAVYGVTGAALLLFNRRWQDPRATFLGLLLLSGASLWGLWQIQGFVGPVWGTTLAVEALALGAFAAWRNSPAPTGRNPARDAGTLLAVLAGAVALACGWQAESAGDSPWALTHAVTALTLAALCLLEAWPTSHLGLARMAHVLLLVAVLIVAGWTGERWHITPPALPFALGSAGESLLLALAALVLRLRSSAHGRTVWPEVLEYALAETAAAAGLVALLFTWLAPTAPAQAGVLVAVAATAFLLAGWYRHPLFTWLGSTLVLAALDHLLRYGLAAHALPHPLLTALLIHSTLALLVAFSLRHASERSPTLAAIGQSGFASSLFVVPVLMGQAGASPGVLAFFTLWLAGLWLATALLEQWPLLFDAFQVALSAAVLLFVAARLGSQPQLTLLPLLQVYGIGLAVLCLFWALARIPLAETSLGALLTRPGTLAVDRVILGALVLAAPILTLAGIAPGVLTELGLPWAPYYLPAELRTWPLAASGAAAWTLLGLLTAALLAEARGQVRRPVLSGLVLLALCVPVLLTGRLAGASAASALGWILGIAFIVYSLPLWLRDHLRPTLARLGFVLPAELRLAELARRILVTGTVVPVLSVALFTLAASVLGHPIQKPLPGSLFERMGSLYTRIGPLLMVCLGLLIHALCERLPAYAFAVGLGGNLLAMLVLRSHHRGQPLAEWWVLLVQANAVAFAATALLWLLGRRRLYGERGEGGLLLFQVGLAPHIQLILGFIALAAILMQPASLPASLVPIGSGTGWAALILATVTGAWYARAVGLPLLADFVLLGVLVGGVQLAYSLGAWYGVPWLPYRVVTAAWVVDAGVLLLLGLRLPEKRKWAQDWLALLGALILGLGLRGLAGDPLAPWWTAGVMLVVAALTTGLALQQHREGPLFIGGLCVNGAAGLIVQHLLSAAPTQERQILLLQASILVASAWSLVFLVLGRFLYGTRRPEAAAAPLLTLQVQLGLLGNLVLLVPAAVLLIAQPGDPPAVLAKLGNLTGYLALLAALVPAGILWGPQARRLGLPLGVMIGLVASLMLAFTAARWGGWLPYRVLLVGCVAMALLNLWAGWERLCAGSGLVLGCVSMAGAVVLALGLRSAGVDPSGLWWPAGAALFVGGLGAAVAWGRRDEGWAFGSNLLVLLAASLVLAHFHRGEPWLAWWVRLVQVNLVAGALVAGGWLGARRRLYGTPLPLVREAPLLTFQVCLLLAGNLVLLIGPLTLLLTSPGSLPESVGHAGAPGGWLALLLTLAVAAWYGVRLPERASVAVLCGLGLAVGVLAASTAAHLDYGQFLAYHVLAVSWAVLGGLLLATAHGTLRCSSGDLPPATHRLLGVLQTAVAVIAVLVLGLGLRVVKEDPLRPWGPAGMVLAASILCAGLAVLRRREVWAFAAALGLDLAALLVAWQLAPAQLVRCHVLASAAAALVWLLGSRALYGSPRLSWREVPLLLVQTALTLAGNSVLLLVPLVSLLLDPAAPGANVRAAGDLGGWLALLGGGVVVFWLVRGRLGFRSLLGPMATGLAVGVQAACTTAAWEPGSWLAYHVLTVAWALTGLLLLTVARPMLRRQTILLEEGGRWRLFAAEAAVGLAGVLVLALAVRGALLDPVGPWWSVAAILLVGAQAAAVAVWRRSESWAFLATLCLDLAVSVLVWDSFRLAAPDTWWMQLLQANLLSGSAAALLWLLANYRYYEDRPPGATRTPLLSMQLFLGLAGNAVLLVQPAFLALVLSPGNLPPSVVQADGPTGWLTLLMTAAVAGVQLRITRMQGGAQVLGSLGLAAGLLAACTAARWDHGDFLSYHVLIASWCALATLLVASGSLSVRGRTQHDAQAPLLSAGLVREWLILAGVPVLALALRGFLMDPSGPWWSAGAVLLVSLLAGWVAVAQSRPAWVFAAGLGCNLAVSLVLFRLRPDDLRTLLEVNVVVGALVALVWLLLERRLEQGDRSALTDTGLISLQVLLVVVGNAVLLLPTALALAWRPDFLDPIVPATGTAWAWAALALTGMATLLDTARRRPGGTVAVLFGLVVGLGVLAACSAAQGQVDGWASGHVLMAVWAGSALLLVLVGWSQDRGTETESTLLPATGVQVAALALAALVQGLVVRGGLVDPAGPWWSAGGVAAVSTLFAVLAAWRRREVWAFAAALGVNGAASLVLWQMHLGQPVSSWWVVLVQTNIVASSGAALVWLLLSRYLYDEMSIQKNQWPLRGVQVCLGLAGNALLLLQPLALLVEQPTRPAALVREAGGAIGWLALGLALLPAVLHFSPSLIRAGLPLLGSTGLAVGVLAACTAARWDHGHYLSYHVLNGSWAGLGLMFAASGILARRLTVRDRLGGWSVVFGLLVLLLALREASAGQTSVQWPAVAILTVSAMAACLALSQRREGWAFLAGLGINLAVTLLLVPFRSLAVADGWVTLAQVNVLVLAGVAALWLLGRRWIYVGEDLLTESPLLAAQVGLGLLGNVCLLALPVARLVTQPAVIAPELLRAGSVWGWLALLGSLAVTVGYLGRLVCSGGVHLLGGVGLAVSALAACTAAHWDHGNWLSYHVLTILVALLGGVVLSGPALTDTRTAWTAALGAVVVGLGLRGAFLDPRAPWWPAATVLVASGFCAGLALRRGSEVWAFLAALGPSLAAALVVWHAHQAEPLLDWWVWLAQAGLLAGSTAALLWLLAARWLYGATERVAAPLLGVHILLGAAGNALLLLGPLLALTVQPAPLLPSVPQAGSVWGWLTFLLALAATSWYVGRALDRVGLHILCGLGLLLALLVACTAARWDAGGYLAYHVQLTGWAVVGAATLVVGRVVSGGETEVGVLVRSWSSAIGLLVVGLALRGVGHDPAGPWWSATGLLIEGLMAGALAAWSGRLGFVHAGSLLLTGAGVLFGIGCGVQEPLALVHVVFVSLAISAALAAQLEAELRVRQRAGALSFATPALFVCLAALLVLVIGQDLALTLGRGLPTAGAWTWVLLLTLGLTLILELWDSEAVLTLAGLYIVALSALGMCLPLLPPTARWLMVPGLALFVLLAALLQRTRASWRQVEQWLGLPLRKVPRALGWLEPAQTLLACLATILGLWLSLTGVTFLSRTGGPAATALLLPAVVWMAGSRTGERRALAQGAALFLGALALVELAWVGLPAGLPAPWLQHTGLLLAAVAILTLVYGVLLPRLLPAESGWPDQACQAGAVLAVLAGVLLVAVLAQEALAYRPGMAPVLLLPVLLAVAAAVLLLLTAGICFALLPGLDPLGLSERGRCAYVYAAEGLLVVLFVHLRLAAPAWFGGRLVQYWPFVVLALAFVGSGLGELFARLHLRVLDEPLRRTGLFLPLVPVVGFWLRPAGDYATLWFLLGLFYALLSLVRREQALALLAALAANAGLWVVLHERQVAFLHYPQLWLVPFALTLLVAGQLNRDRLTRRQLNGLRYAALTAIYLASTAETFLSGLGHDALRPAILIGLALLGLFAGMLLRVRAFLYLGASAVCLGVLALVWHAAESRSWLWYVAGIVLGVIIIVLFAVFEKRRNDVLSLLEKLRSWE